MEDFVAWWSREYFTLLAVLVFSRGMDFLSTWVATPNLVLEANPIARRLGWKGGLLINLPLVVLAPAWPLPALIIATASVLVAARNFQSAWLMRSMGEEGYRDWMTRQITRTGLPLYLFALTMQTSLVALVGAALVLFNPDRLVAFAIGMGLMTYACAVAFFNALGVWRLRR
jgi:hypothetical protein